jgi:hypothetical protein
VFARMVRADDPVVMVALLAQGAEYREPDAAALEAWFGEGNAKEVVPLNLLQRSDEEQVGRLWWWWWWLECECCGLGGGGGYGDGD